MPIADTVGGMGTFARSRAMRAISHLERRFPQLQFATVLAEVPAQAPLIAYAFWLFNRGQLSSAVEKGGENHVVMLLIDSASERAIAMVGYGLEPFIQETHLQSCLQASAQSIRRRQFGQAIESFARELGRQLGELCLLVPRQFGLVEERMWLDVNAPGDEAVGMAESLY